MPDIWTKHPDIVRSLLEEGGFTCGVEPRVLKGRDPAWTCLVDGTTISGDIYIHHVDALHQGHTHMTMAGAGPILGLLALGACLVLARRRGKHPRPPSG